MQQCDRIWNMRGSAWVQENGGKLMGRCMVGTEWCTNHGKKAVEPVCVCRDFVIWHSAHGVDWVKLDTELNMDIPMVHKTPLGTSVEMHMCGWVAWSVVFSGSWNELGV